MREDNHGHPQTESAHVVMCKYLYVYVGGLQHLTCYARIREESTYTLQQFTTDSIKAMEQLQYGETDHWKI